MTESPLMMGNYGTMESIQSSTNISTDWKDYAIVIMKKVRTRWSSVTQEAAQRVEKYMNKTDKEFSKTLNASATSPAKGSIDSVIMANGSAADLVPPSDIAPTIQSMKNNISNVIQRFTNNTLIAQFDTMVEEIGALVDLAQQQLMLYALEQAQEVRNGTFTIKSTTTTSTTTTTTEPGGHRGGGGGGNVVVTTTTTTAGKKSSTKTTTPQLYSSSSIPFPSSQNLSPASSQKASIPSVTNNEVSTKSLITNNKFLGSTSLR